MKSAGVKMLDEIDGITRRSIACPAFPLCGLAVTEAERVQPDINKRLHAKLCEMGLHDTVFVTRTTGCPNGCARPYMAEIAFVGSGPNSYQLWLGGSPSQSERTGYATDIFKMKYDDLEATVEPIFAMYKSQKSHPEEAFGDFCHRVGWPSIKEFMDGYKPGDFASMPDPFAPALLPTPDSSVGIDSSVLAKVEAAAKARGLDANTLLDMIVREALD